MHTKFHSTIDTQTSLYMHSEVCSFWMRLARQLLPEYAHVNASVFSHVELF